MVEEHRLAAGALELIDHQHLVGIVARQAIGGANQHGGTVALGDQITQPVEAGAGQCRPAAAVIGADQIGRQGPAALPGGTAQGVDLAVDGLLPLLLVRGNTGVGRHQLQGTRRRRSRGT